MSYATSNILIEDLLEGSPLGEDFPEPRNPLATSINPIIAVETHSMQAETGIVSAVEVPSEGKDDDDAQDASRTTAEAKPIAKSETMINANPQGEHAPIVLIVEDTMELAEVIQATLERMNMVTIHETHGNKALNALEEVKPDVVLLDISLPDMTGWKILDTLKEKYGDDGLPAVIVITAYGDPANRLVGKLQGVYSYLIKPFTSDEVEDIVTRALRSEV